MKKSSIFLLTLFIFLPFGKAFSSSFSTNKDSNRSIDIIPKPQNIVLQKGEFVLSSKTSICYSTTGSKKVADFFSSKLNRATGIKFNTTRKYLKNNSIQLIIDTTLIKNNEGYKLTVKNRVITVKAKTAQGLFYGMQTLMQLFPPEIENKTVVKNIKWSVPGIIINDEPRFEYRGVMLDVCRHFMPVESIKKQLDVLSLFKINTFHWHLTDDQGWRIEIKRYPKLTEIGSKRVEPDGRIYEGFYTQDQIREIVDFAAERFITIVPEIEMPGHSMGAISAYPDLACFPKDYKVRNIMGIEQDVYCAGKENTFGFIEDVISEIISLFPGQYFHIGGDECPKERWKVCLLCQQRIKDEGLKDEHELQSYFVQRVQKILAQHQKKMIGWDEILEGGLAPSATVMSWRGEKGGIEAANMDHDVIMTPSTEGMYLDYYQGDPKIEPVAIGGYVTLEKTYNYDPVPATIPVEKQKHIKGAQCNVWTEFMFNPDIIEYRMYPRILALAELTWTPKSQKNILNFYQRLNNALMRLDEHHINYHIPQPEQPNGSCNFIAFTDFVSLEFTTSRPIEMIYTLDGSEPTINSRQYTEPLHFRESALLKIRSVLPTGKMSKTRTIKIDNQNLSPATTPVNLKKGLKLKYTLGSFLSMSEIPKTSVWKDTVVTSVSDIAGIKGYEPVPSSQYAAIAQGYVNIPDNSVYFLSSNYEKVWIDGKLIICNDGEVKLNSRNDSSIALEKGFHELKIEFTNNNYGFWPSSWGDGSVKLRKSDETQFKPITSEIIFY